MSAELDTKAGGHGNKGLAWQVVASRKWRRDDGVEGEVQASHRQGPCCYFCNDWQLALVLAGQVHSTGRGKSLS